MSSNESKGTETYRNMDRTIDVEKEIDRKDIPRQVKLFLEFENYFIVDETKITNTNLGSQGILYKFSILRHKRWRLNSSAVISKIEDFRVIFHPEEETVSVENYDHFKFPMG